MLVLWHRKIPRKPFKKANTVDCNIKFSTFTFEIGFSLKNVVCVVSTFVSVYVLLKSIKAVPEIHFCQYINESYYEMCSMAKINEISNF